MCMLSPQPTHAVGRFRRETEGAEMLRKRSGNFACETILFRQAPRKLLKSLGREIRYFRGFHAISMVCDPSFFCAFFRRPFSDPPVGPNLDLVSQNSSIARIRFQGKPKGESLSLQICAVPRNRSSSPSDQPFPEGGGMRGRILLPPEVRSQSRGGVHYARLGNAAKRTLTPLSRQACGIRSGCPQAGRGPDQIGARAAARCRT
jgi:hypothetical protein